MDKRYQVFISSTYLDLKEERQAVSKALLRSDCFPAQMENWPAMDEEQFEAIKQIIDDSDYYVVISAGKYGSVEPNSGLSYTELEYDYAVQTDKPIIRLLHPNPFNALTGKQIESKPSVRKLLEAFHKKLKTGSVCSFWENPDQLMNETILGLLDIKKRKPAVGWVKGKNALTVEVLQELSELRKKLNQKEKRQSETVINFEDRVGDSKVKIIVSKAGELEDQKILGEARVPNKLIAKQVFLALLGASQQSVSDTGVVASNVLTDTFIFSKAAQKWDHCWLDFEYETVRNCLLYLETRGLASCRSRTPLEPETWSTTTKGRRHAVFIVANQEFE